MQYSKILTCATLAVVSALVVVQASQYGNNNYNNNNNNNHARPYGNAMSHYPSAGCQGYHCNKQASQSPYGPYHSYAVRPVIYGGHGLYTYKGYARHPPAPSNGYHKQRHPRSYGMAQQRRRPAAAACHGRYCAAPARHYAPQASRQYGKQQSYQQQSYQQQSYPQQSYHQMRPVKALALAPANNYRARPAYQPQQQQQYHGGYTQAASYGSGQASAHSSNHYASANNNAHQQQYNNGGHKANYNGY